MSSEDKQYKFGWIKLVLLVLMLYASIKLLHNILFITVKGCEPCSSVYNGFPIIIYDSTGLDCFKAHCLSHACCFGATPECCNYEECKSYECCKEVKEK